MPEMLERCKHKQPDERPMHNPKLHMIKRYSERSDQTNLHEQVRESAVSKR